MPRKRRSCPSHPDRQAVHRCCRCGTAICGTCSIHIGFRRFCDRGCGVIQSMQQLAEAEWQVAQRLVRDLPVPPRLRRRVTRRQRVLHRVQTGPRTRGVRPARVPWQLALHPRWALLVLIPLLVLLSQVGTLVLIPSSTVEWRGQRATVVPVVPLMVTPPPIVVKKPPDPVPPKTVEVPRLPPETDFSRGPTWERQVALTFDGGAEANATPEILHTLKRMGVRATIFLTGDYIRHYPDLVRRMVGEGHEIGNHTSTHPHLTTFAATGRHDTLPNVSREFVQHELLEAARLLNEIAGVPMSPYWRAPYGEHNEQIRRWAGEIGYLHVGWTRDFAAREDLDTRDWVVDPRSSIYYRAEEVRDRILNFGKGSSVGANGGIILFHLGTQRKEDPIHGELPAIITGLLGQGYRLVPVSELHRELVVGEGGTGSAVAAGR